MAVPSFRNWLCPGARVTRASLEFANGFKGALQASDCLPRCDPSRPVSSVKERWSACTAITRRGMMSLRKPSNSAS